MKNKVEKFVIAALASVMMLASLGGCKSNDDRDAYTGYYDKATILERAVISRLYDYCRYQPSYVIKAISERKERVPEAMSFKGESVESAVKAYDAIHSCEHRDKMNERYQVSPSNDIEHLFFAITGKKLYEDHALPVTRTIDTVTVENKKYISPEMIQSLTVAVKDCFNAKRKMSILLDQNNNLITEEDYNSVMAIVMQCSTDKLRAEVNKVQ